MRQSGKFSEPGIEEILASIRSMAATDGVARDDDGGSSLATVEDDVFVDESDFDLPAMFRTSSPGASVQTYRRHFGRAVRIAPLSERLASAVAPETDADPDGQVVRPERASTSEDPASAVFELAVFHETQHYDMLGMNDVPASLALGKDAVPPLPPVPVPLSGTGVNWQGVVSEPSAVPRQLTAFTDTRFSSLGSKAVMSCVASEALRDCEQRATTPLSLTGTVSPSGAANDNAAAVAMGEGGLSFDDATAHLLRPVLRQWLAENMPQMLEKAFPIETGRMTRQTKYSA